MSGGTVSDQEIKIGLSVSVSGKFRLQGRQALDGVLLWQSHANASGGISIGGTRRPVRLIWHDDSGHASRVRENVQRLIENDHVHVLLGPYSSGLTIAAAEIAEDHGRTIWNYGGTSDEIFRRGWRYVIGVSSPASDYLRKLPHVLAREYAKLSRICVLYSAKGSFAWQVARGVMESAKETGHSTELVPFEAPLGNSDASVAALLAASPETVVLVGNFDDELMVMRTRPRWPRTVRAIASVAAGIPEFAIQLGQLAEGVVGPSQWEPGVNSRTTIGPSCDWFVEEFQKQSGVIPNYIAAGSFVAGLIAAECICQAATLDDDKLRSIASALDCNTFYGRFRIDPETGKQTGHRILLVRWERGQKIVLPSR